MTDDNGHKGGGAVPSSSESNRKKLSFYNEDDDSDRSSSPSNSKQSDQSKLDKSISTPANSSTILNRSTKVATIQSDKNDPETSSTVSSCSCEDHSSVVSHDDFHGDLDYDYEGSISPDRPTTNEKSKKSSSSSAKTSEQIDRSNIDSETIQLSVNNSSSKSSESGDDELSKTGSTPQHTKKPKIKSVINFHHTNEVDDDQQSHISDDRAARDKSEKSYDHLLKYFFKDACYFQIKSINHENVDLSKSMGVWSTSVHNEVRLNQAFREHRNVILIFSVQQSGGFQGFARMISESRPSSRPVPWVLPERLSNKSLGGIFKLEWLCTKELSFHEVNHLLNPYNDNKPVKVARDGQQVEPRVAKKLCQLFPQDSEDPLVAAVATLKRQTSHRKKSSHDTLYPFVGMRQEHHDDRLRPNFGPIHSTNGIDDSCLHSIEHRPHPSIYRPFGQRRMFEHSNYGPYPRHGIYPDHFNCALPRIVNGFSRYPQQHAFHHNQGFMPPFNHQFPGPYNMWHPNPVANRYHPYQRSRR